MTTDGRITGAATWFFKIETNDGKPLFQTWTAQAQNFHGFPEFRTSIYLEDILADHFWNGF